MMQVVSFKLTGKRIFRMRPASPFRTQGLGEPKVIVRFWIVSFVSFWRVRDLKIADGKRGRGSRQNRRIVLAVFREARDCRGRTDSASRRRGSRNSGPWRRRWTFAWVLRSLPARRRVAGVDVAGRLAR